jgi:O-antigen/teichoic acid export membrane protein
VAQIGVMGINLLVLPLFIKNLGAELYGIWILSGVVMGYLNVFDFGFTQGLQKYVAEARVKGDHKELSEVVVTGTGLLLIIGLLLGVLFWAGAQPIVEFFNIQPEHQLIATRLLRISAVFCVVMWPLRIVDVVLNATMHIKELSFLNAFKTGVQSLVMLGMVWMVQDVVLIKWVTAALMAGCSVGGLMLTTKYVPEISWNLIHFKIQQLKRMHKFSLGMFYTALILMFQSQIDPLIVAKYMTMAMITSYVVASKLFMIVQKISSLAVGVLTPASYSVAASGDKNRLARLTEESVFFRCVLATFFSSIAFYVAPDFIFLWVGPEFHGVTLWARVYLLMCPFISLANVSQIGKAAGEICLVNKFITAEIILNVALSIILVRWFGIGGPILGTVISFFLTGAPVTTSILLKKIGISSATRMYSLVLPSVAAAYFIVVLLSFLPFGREPGWMTLIMKSGLGMIFVGGGLAILVNRHLRRNQQSGLIARTISTLARKGG